MVIIGNLPIIHNMFLIFLITGILKLINITFTSKKLMSGTKTFYLGPYELSQKTILTTATYWIKGLTYSIVFSYLIVANNKAFRCSIYRLAAQIWCFIDARTENLEQICRATKRRKLINLYAAWWKFANIWEYISWQNF